jgi:hypothetical protein
MKSRQALGVNPASYTMGIVGCFPGGYSARGLKLTWSAEVKYGGAIPPLSHTVLN